MLDHLTLEELTNKISSLLPNDLKLLQNDIKTNIRAILESTLNNANLISREEFDVQSALLSRTMEKLNKLEQQITDLEK